MNDKVTAVLDAYHERMAEERRLREEMRAAGTDFSGMRDRFLLAVGPRSGRLLNILASSLEAPTILELGTSYGYSTIWLAEAARATGGRVITMELQDYKSAHAREMVAKAGLADFVDFRVGDAVAMIGDVPDGIDFVLVDLWKDLYLPCLDAFYPKLNPGAVVVADNIVSSKDAGIGRYVESIRTRPGMASVLLPVGSGLEVSRLEAA